jgi:hypothetical protein
MARAALVSHLPVAVSSTLSPLLLFTGAPPQCSLFGCFKLIPALRVVIVNRG